jgi:nucleotidyltransferase/DNA polymerase involved in DNA repair
MLGCVARPGNLGASTAPAKEGVFEMQPIASALQLPPAPTSDLAGSLRSDERPVRDQAARDALREIIDKVWGYSERSGIRGRTVTLKVKFANFRQITRSRTGQTQIKNRSELEQLSDALLEPLFPVTKGVRLLGVSLSSLAAEEAERENQVSLSL